MCSIANQLATQRRFLIFYSETLSARKPRRGKKRLRRTARCSGNTRYKYRREIIPRRGTNQIKSTTLEQGSPYTRDKKIGDQYTIVQCTCCLVPNHISCVSAELRLRLLVDIRECKS